jgi:hypothetical protein
MGWKTVLGLTVFLAAILFWAAWDIGAEAANRFAETVTGALK